jgi:uncharacterized coiled-coil protein SlyX
MSELYARLSDMRTAAESLRTSARRVDASVQGTVDSLDSLFALGLSTPDLQTRYLVVRSHMTDWATALARFADELTDAADAIESATNGNFTPIQWHSPVTALPDPQPIAMVGAFAGAGYVAAHNMPLYRQWQDRQLDLQTRQADLAALVSTRTEIADDLTALKNRLQSYDSSANVDMQPRVMALEAQIAELDADIASLETDIDLIQADLDHLAGRLEAVSPTPGADIGLIAGYEGTESPEWLSQNTYDCVQHVVRKLHIPSEIARDAHLWVDLALEHPAYGIGVGEVPLEGAVLVMPPEHTYADDVYGHVMYVEGVTDGEVFVTDNNHPETPVRLSDLTDDRTGLTYLYFPWHTRG